VSFVLLVIAGAMVLIFFWMNGEGIKVCVGLEAIFVEKFLVNLFTFV
jgi:hypothetical protein